MLRPNNRPLSVTILSSIFVLTGVVGFVVHLRELIAQHATLQYDTVLVLLVSLIAVLCGVYMFRGCNWARWLSVAWLAFHVIVSVFHSRQELVMHSVLLALFVYLLFRPEADAYFRQSNQSIGHLDAAP